VPFVRQPLRPLESHQFDDAIIMPPADNTYKWRQAEGTSPLAREPHDAGIDLDLDLHRMCLREDHGTSGSNRPSSSHLSATTRSNSLRHNRPPLSFHEGILYRQRRQSGSAFVDGDEQSAAAATTTTNITDVDEDGELAGLWAASPPFRPMSAGHMSNLSSCSDDSGVVSVTSSRSVSESDDSWGDLGLSAAAPVFTPTNYDALTSERPLSLSVSPAPFLVGGPAMAPAISTRLNPPALDVVSIGSGVSSRPASSLCSEAGDVVPVLALSEDGLELTHTQIKHALPEWMCAEVCELKRKKTRRGCRGHRRNRKKEDAAPAGMPPATMGLHPTHALGPRSSPVPGRSQDQVYAGSAYLKQPQQQQQQQHYMGPNELQHMQAVPVFIPSGNGGFVPTMALQPVSWQRGHFASEGHNFMASSMTV
jgi:hypothetical protein